MPKGRRQRKRQKQQYLLMEGNCFSLRAQLFWQPAPTIQAPSHHSPATANPLPACLCCFPGLQRHSSGGLHSLSWHIIRRPPSHTTVQLSCLTALTLPTPASAGPMNVCVWGIWFSYPWKYVQRSWCRGDTRTMLYLPPLVIFAHPSFQLSCL